MSELLSRSPRRGASRPTPETGTTRRRTPPRRPHPAPPQPVTWAGLLAALRSAGLGLLTVMVLVLVAWASAADSGASATEAVAGGAQIWLVGHLARLSVPGGVFGLPPLGLTLLPALLLFTSATRAARAARVADRRGVVSLTAAVAAPYATLAVAVALLARSEGVQVMPATAFLGAATLAVVAAGAGALRGSGRAPAAWARLPLLLRVAATGAAGALGVLCASGALLVAVLLLRHRHDAAALANGVGGGATALLLVGLICLVYVPTAVLWGVSWLLGPGFALGTGTSVGVTGTHLAAVPALPLLAALPSGDGWGWWLAGPALAGAGVTAGLLADRAARRRRLDLTSWRSLGSLAAATGGLAGVAVAAGALLASGPAGPGRLAHTGPTPWVVGPVAAGEVALLVLAVLVVRRLQSGRRAEVAGINDANDATGRADAAAPAGETEPIGDPAAH